MRKNFVFLPALAMGAVLVASAQSNPPQTKVGIIHIQNAIISTKEGQKAAADLQSKFAPKKADLDKKQNAISQLQDQLRQGANTMSDDAKDKLMREIDRMTKSLNRESEDDQADLDQAQQKVMRQLGQKMMAVIDKYAKENGYALILDVSSQTTPVLYATNSIDITQDIIALYDKTSAAAATSSAAPAAKPGAGVK